MYATKKVNNKLLEYSISYNDDAFLDKNVIKDEQGYPIPYSINYTDIDKNEKYELYYDINKNKYQYYDKKDDIKDVDLESNFIKENTLSYIPSKFKDMCLLALNPLCYYVDIINNEYKYFSINYGILSNNIIKLSQDGLITMYYMQTSGENENIIEIDFSYDYVQENFKEIENPIENYGDKIFYEE